MPAVELNDRHYRVFFEGGTEGMVLVSGDETLLDINPEACNILGRGRREALDGGLRGVLDTSDPGWKSVVEELRAGEKRRCALRFLQGDGTPFVAEASFAKHSDANGQSLLSVVFKEPLEKVRRLNGTLESQVVERTTELETAVAALEDKERMLRESEERFRALVQHASDLVVVLDPNGVIIYESPAVERVLGFKPEERIGTNGFDHLHPDDLGPVQSKLTSLLEKPEERMSAEYRVRDKGGRWRCFEAIGTNLLDDPTIRGVVINARDVTERKKAEEALRRSEGLLRSGVANVPIVLFATDSEGVFTLSEGRCLESLGVKPDDVVGRSVFDLYQDIPQVLGNIKLALAGEEQHTIVDVGGIVFETWYSPLRGQDGEILGVVGVAIDVTERKQAEEELEKSEERYRTFIRQSREGIWRFELEQPLATNLPEEEQLEHVYRYVYLAECNDAMARMYGFSRAQEIIGARLGDLLPRSIPENVEYLRAFARSGYVLSNGETQEIDRQGNVKHFLNNLTGIVEDGSLVRIWGIQQDVTEHRKVEAALRQNEELYRTVVEQAAENIYLVDAETNRVLEANAALHRSLGYAEEELRQLTLYDIVAHDRVSVDLNVRRILEEGLTFVGERQYRRRDGSLMDVEASASAVSYGGRKALCIVAHDVTERKRAESTLRRSLDSLLALYEIGHVLSSTLEAEEIGLRLLEIMRRISNLTTAVVSTLNEHGQLRVRQAVGFESLPERARFAPEVQATFQTVLETGEHRLFRLEHSGKDGEPLLGLCLPLRVHNRSIGLLEIYGPESLLEEDTVEILSSMTTQAAGALENARLYGELADREAQLENLVGKLLAAQEEERRHVAYEVHDGLAQVAVAAHQRLQAFASRYPPDSEKGRSDLDRILGLVQRTVEDSRRVIADLRPTALDDFGLAVALRQEVEELRNEGWLVDYDERLGDERLPANVEITLYRIGHEALTNARKHAGTDRIRLELRRREGMASLEVRDWGRGFDPDALNGEAGPGERVGLSGMRERAGVLGGEFEVRSRPGEGTSVTVRLPLPAEDRKEDHDQS